MIDPSKYKNIRLQRERDECRASAEQLANLAGRVRYIMEQDSTPLHKCPTLEIAYLHLIACSESMANCR